MIPCGHLGNVLTDSQYIIILIIQTCQSSTMCTVFLVTDSFYFGIILHLASQLEVLHIKFRTFAIKSNTQAVYRREFINLIDKHNELMKLNQNLEDSFHIIILFQLIFMTILLSLTGNVNEKHCIVLITRIINFYTI